MFQCPAKTFDVVARTAKLNKLQWNIITVLILVVNRIWQLFDSLDIFSADATEETKICHDKICSDFVGMILVLSVSADRPIRMGNRGIWLVQAEKNLNHSVKIGWIWNRKFDKRRTVFSSGFVESLRYAFITLRSWMVTIILNFSVTQAKSPSELFLFCWLCYAILAFPMSFPFLSFPFTPFHNKISRKFIYSGL